MTTIVANLEGMAADTRVSEEGAPHYPATKIFRIGNSLFGTAGHGDMCLVMVEWLKTAQRSRMALYKQWAEYDRDQFVLLELRHPGELYRWSGWGLPERIRKDRFAIGSGAFSALSAYDAVASFHTEKQPITAEQLLRVSVKAGCQLDQYSGDPIEYVPLKLKSRRKR